MTQKVHFNNLTGDSLAVGNTVIDGTGVSVNGSRLGGSVEIYSNNASLPTSGLTKGSFLFSQANNSLYYSDGNGFYRLTLINETPSVTFDVDSVTLGYSGNTALINYTVVDPEGTPATLTVSNSGISDTNIITITNYTGNNTLQIQNVGMSVSNTYTLSLSAEDDVGNIGIASANIIIDFAPPTAYTYLWTPDGTFGDDTGVTVTSSGLSTLTSGIASQTVSGKMTEVSTSGDYLRIQYTNTDFTREASKYKFVWAWNVPSYDGTLRAGLTVRDEDGRIVSFSTESDPAMAVFQGTTTTSRLMSPTMSTSNWYIMTAGSSYDVASLLAAKVPGGSAYTVSTSVRRGYAHGYATNNNEFIMYSNIAAGGIISGFNRAALTQYLAGVAIYPTTMTDEEMLDDFDSVVFGN